MKFIHRLGYYLGGFAIGLILLAFFLNGKKTSCDYGPNARTIKNISLKSKQYTEDALETMRVHHLDSTIVNDLIKYGEVNFSESDTKSENCKTYSVENSYKEKGFLLRIKNCDSLATILAISLKQ